MTNTAPANERRKRPTAVLLGLLAVGAVGFVATVGVVVSMFVSAFDNYGLYQCRARQSSAKVNLRQAAEAQHAFHVDNGRFGTLKEIGFMRQGKLQRYVFDAQAKVDTFVITATGLDAMKGDVWVVTEATAPTIQADLCLAVSAKDPS